MEKFKKVLPVDKYYMLENLVKRLQAREVSREEFDSRYFELMLPYVTPAALPAQYVQAVEIHIPPYRLTSDARNNFVNFFNLTQDQKYEMLQQKPDLIPVLRQFVILQKQRQLPVTTSDAVLKVDGEEEIKLQPAASSSKDEAQPAAKKQKIDDGTSLQTQFTTLQQEYDSYKKQAEEQIAQLQEDLKMLNDKYVNAKVAVLDAMSYDELSALSDMFLANMNAVNSARKRKHSEEENEKHGMHCIICCENRKNVVFRPCSHVVQCDSCPVPRQCPICKKKIELACKVYV